MVASTAVRNLSRTEWFLEDAGQYEKANGARVQSANWHRSDVPERRAVAQRIRVS